MDSVVGEGLRVSSAKLVAEMLARKGGALLVPPVSALFENAIGAGALGLGSLEEVGLLEGL